MDNASVMQTDIFNTLSLVQVNFYVKSGFLGDAFYNRIVFSYATRGRIEEKRS
jgi:hypothetical protein